MIKTIADIRQCQCKVGKKKGRKSASVVFTTYISSNGSVGEISF